MSRPRDMRETDDVPPLDLSLLRLQLHDALFMRAGGGVRPTPSGDRLAGAVQQALAPVAAALNEREAFGPARTPMTLLLHPSDIGEARFLPELLATLHQRPPLARTKSASCSCRG